MNAGSVYAAAGAPVWPIVVGMFVLLILLGVFLWGWRAKAGRIYFGGLTAFTIWFVIYFWRVI